MARARRDATLETRSNRLKLKPRKAPYWSPLGEGEAVGYYRPPSGAAGVWQAKWRDKATGDRKAKALGTADDFQDADGMKILDWTQAQAAARDWFAAQNRSARLKAAGEVVHEGPYTVADAIKDYVRDCERRGIRGLDRQACQINAHILPALGSVEVAKLSRGQIERWHEALSKSAKRLRTKKGLAPRTAEAPTDDKAIRARRDTANRVLTTLKAALNHAHDRKIVRGETPWRDVKSFKGTTRSRDRFLTLAEQVRLVNACPPDFRRLVQAALFTGARFGELCRLNVKDFNPDAGTLWIEPGKTEIGRHIILTPEAQDWFKGQVAGRSSSEPLFQREAFINPKQKKEMGKGYRAWKQSEQSRPMIDACTGAEIERLCFHELRHSAASLWVNRGVPLAFVAAQLGHKSIVMVQKHYGHLCKDAMANTLRALDPLGIAEPAKVINLDIG